MAILTRMVVQTAGIVAPLYTAGGLTPAVRDQILRSTPHEELWLTVSSE